MFVLESREGEDRNLREEGRDRDRERASIMSFYSIHLLVGECGAGESNRMEVRCCIAKCLVRPTHPALTGVGEGPPSFRNRQVLNFNILINIPFKLPCFAQLFSLTR